ncbi:MAG: galactose mutarotase [Ruminiclostridium sp.]|nr:galactose mutarotase [Ruminiclostridium sp.]
MSVEKILWGSYNGKDCYLVTLKNKNMTASFTSFGGAVVNLFVPDKNGNAADVVLGYDNLEGYVNGSSCHGALVGRYANRIGNARFTLNGEEIKIAPNDNGVNHLHGGNVGFNKKVWDIKEIGEKENPYVIFTYTSVDGEENYPGTVVLDVTYTLTEDSLEIAYNAVSDKDTIMNFTNHAYFNLAGYDARDILDHEIRLYADKYTPVDELLIPTGEKADVKGTPFDFTLSKKIRQDMDNGRLPNGYDHNFILGETIEMRKAAEVYDAVSGRVMTTYTDKPAIQLYIGIGLGGEKGKSGTEIGKYQGFCLESQYSPDTPNKPQFKPSCVYKAGEQYKFTTIYKFSHR